MFRSLLELYLIFFRMGAVTFGGGYTMLPILRREITQKRNWMDEEAIMDYYALSQGLPGIIAVNVSVFIGYRRRRVYGAVAAALGIVSPCVVIITVIAACLSNFQDNVQVQHALAGISVCVGALILDAVLSMWKKGVKDVFGAVLCFAILSLSLFTRLSPVLLVVGSALLGIWMGRRKKEAL
nr:chromate transporter [uncultured Oscillibacter sp.]